MTIWLTILGMAMITFTTRYAFLSRGLKVHLGENGQKLLEFTVPALLTAFWAPMVFSHKPLESALHISPELLAGVFTIVISLLIQKTLLIVALGMCCYFALNILAF